MQKLLKKNLFSGLLVLWVGIFLAQLLFSSVVLPGSASASTATTDAINWGYGTIDNWWSPDQVTARWISRWTIEIGPVSNPEIRLLAKDVYLPFGTTHAVFSIKEHMDKDCQATLKVAVADPTLITVDMDLAPNDLGQCANLTPNEITLTAKNPELARAYFRWVDGGRIQQIPKADGTMDLGLFIQHPEHPNVYVRENEADAGGSGCEDRIVVDENDKHNMKFFELDNKYGGDTPEDEAFTSCDYREWDDEDGPGDAPSNSTLYLAETEENSGLPPGEGTTIETVVGGDGEDSCETSGFDFSWIFCSMINGMASLTQGIFTNIIEPYLETSPVDTSPTTVDNQPNPIYQVWSAMRNIANIILIFALLFIVFGQSIGGGLVDAYTAKKSMPRILVAAVLINLSLFIVAGLVDLFNVIGRGIGDLIIGPFQDTTFAKFKTSSGSGSVGVIVAAVATVLITAIVLAFKTNNATAASDAYLIPFLHFLIISVLIPAVLVSLAIFATLIIRRSLILVLIVLAPVAFALFAVPNTDKYFKKWWSTLTTTLMVYPLITILFSVSAIMAAISYNAGDTVNAPLSGTISAVVALIIMIVPLVLIPFAFKLAGGVMTGIAGGFKGQADKFTASRKRNYQEAKSLQAKIQQEHNTAGRFSAGGIRSRQSDARTKMFGSATPGGATMRTKTTWRARAAARRASRTPTGPATTRVGVLPGTGGPLPPPTLPTSPFGPPTTPLMPPPTIPPPPATHVPLGGLPGPTSPAWKPPTTPMMPRPSIPPPPATHVPLAKLPRGSTTTQPIPSSPLPPPTPPTSPFGPPTTPLMPPPSIPPPPGGPLPPPTPPKKP